MTDRRLGWWRAGIMAAVVGALPVGPGAATRQSTLRPLPGFEDTSAWARLAAAHEPGKIDEALRTVATWASPRLDRVAHDLRLVGAVLGAAERGNMAASMPGVRGEDFYIRSLTLSLLQIERLLGLPEGVLRAKEGPREAARPDSAGRRAIAVLMARAAMLHADLMMAPPEELRAAGVEPATSVTRASRIVDGLRFEVPSAAVHWNVARGAIDLIAPTPGGQPAVGLWYYATSAFLIGRREYDSGRPHLEHAVRVYPRDAGLAYLIGAVCENLASAAVQALTDTDRAGVRLEPRDELLGAAERHLRQALDLDPALAVAGLRLARVLQVTGRYEDGLGVLQRALPSLERAELAYYGALFLGRSLEAVGREELARTAFERARDLYPRAQSPHLALSRLAFRSTTPGEAATNIGRLYGLDEETADGLSGDPWWFYDVSPAFDAMDRILAMRAAIDAFLR